MSTSRSDEKAPVLLTKKQKERADYLARRKTQKWLQATSGRHDEIQRSFIQACRGIHWRSFVAFERAFQSVGRRLLQARKIGAFVVKQAGKKGHRHVRIEVKYIDGGSTSFTNGYVYRRTMRRAVA